MRILHVQNRIRVFYSPQPATIGDFIISKQAGNQDFKYHLREQTRLPRVMILGSLKHCESTSSCSTQRPCLREEDCSLQKQVVK